MYFQSIDRRNTVVRRQENSYDFGVSETHAGNVSVVFKMIKPIICIDQSLNVHTLPHIGAKFYYHMQLTCEKWFLICLERQLK